MTCTVSLALHCQYPDNIFQNVTYTFTGTSNVTGCTSAVQGVFNYNQPCEDPPCSFDGVSQPSLYGEYLVCGTSIIYIYDSFCIKCHIFIMKITDIQWSFTLKWIEHLFIVISNVWKMPFK